VFTIEERFVSEQRNREEVRSIYPAEHPKQGTNHLLRLLSR